MNPETALKRISSERAEEKFEKLAFMKELRNTFQEFSDSIRLSFAEDRAMRDSDKANAGPVAALAAEFTKIQKTLTDSLVNDFSKAFGKDGVLFSNSTITAPNATVNVTPTASGASPVTKSSGFIPSFYNPLREAVKRETQYVPLSSVRINRSNKLINQDNPLGLAVTNTLDEPNGLRDVGIFSRGFVPNFAAFGDKKAMEARKYANAGILYAFDNLDNKYRKVNPDGSIENAFTAPKDLPIKRKVITNATAELPYSRESEFLGIRDPGVTKLDELKTPGFARSTPIDGIMAKLKTAGSLTPKNLLDEINKISKGQDTLVKTAFGKSNLQGLGVYGRGGPLSTSDTRSIIEKYGRGTGSGFFTQAKVPLHYGELRVHVAVDNKGNAKIIKGGTVLKNTKSDPTSRKSIRAYKAAGLTKKEATKMARSYRKAAEATALESTNALIKAKGIKNASFGFDIGATSLAEAIKAGVKPREFHSGDIGKFGRVSTIAIESNPSDIVGRSGYVGKNVLRKFVQGVFGRKFGKPMKPADRNIMARSIGKPNSLPAGFQQKGFGGKLAGALGSGLSGLSAGFQKLTPFSTKGFTGALGSGLSGLSALGLGLQSYNSFKEGEAIDAGLSGGASLALAASAIGKFGKISAGGIGASGALTSVAEAKNEIRNREYGNAAISATQAGLYATSIFAKAAPLSNILGKGALGVAGNAFGYASALGLAKDIANAKNFELASNWSDVLFGKKEQGGGFGDLLGTAMTARSGPVGAAVATAKIGYKLGNVLGNKIGLEESFGNLFTSSEAASRAKTANASLAGPITKQDVIGGKNSISEFIKVKKSLLDQRPDLNSDQVYSSLNKDLAELNEAKSEKSRSEEANEIITKEITARAVKRAAMDLVAKDADEKFEKEQKQKASAFRSGIVASVGSNAEFQTSRDKVNHLMSQEKFFGRFKSEEFTGNEELYKSYKNYSEAAAKARESELKQTAPSVEAFRAESAKQSEYLSTVPKDALEEAARRRVPVEKVMSERSEKRFETQNRSTGFIPNFAFNREKFNILTSPDYAGYRNAAPEPSKYYKNVIKNTAEIEVPATEVYNRMGFFGAQPKNVSEKYAILNPAQQSQLGYSANGFVPNFAPEQFAGAISEALQQVLSPMFDKMGSSVSNSNVINVHDQRSFDMTSEKVNGVMDFLQKQFPTQFAKQMGPKKV